MRVLTFLLTAVFFIVTASQVLAAPKASFESTTFDFGEIYQGDKVPHTFAFTNTGTEILKIDKVRSSCGCTAVLVSEKTIAPGGKGEIQANFDSSRFRGNINKTIYMYSNDPEKPVLKLYIKGEVVEIVAVKPSKVNFGRVDRDESLPAKVVIRNQGEKPMTFGKPTTTAEELQAEMPEVTLSKGEEVSLQLLLSPKPGKSRFSGYIIIPAVGLPKDQLRIPVYATIN